ncbi:MAG TPA: hypothetical protein PL117_03200 [Accumulibacter sp.]|uniref:hypothetical protein n=1 Tax=Accumulibacter sp. TaxID=2053492 RepID=UPI002C1A91A5|nr:hypothetical protein [Accumulibacter sp.]HRF71754.1 hypothetical protein [Accumulibacter sp.]
MNLYASLAEIKASGKDSIGAEITKYDDELLRIAAAVSRAIDRYCRRVFFPALRTDTYSPIVSTDTLWVDDLISASLVEYSTDYGDTYTALTASDYWLAYGDRTNGRRPSANCIILRPTGRLKHWPARMEAARVAGWWGRSDEPSSAFEVSGQAITASVNASDTVLTVPDVDGPGSIGVPPVFAVGQTVRVEDELMAALAIDTGENKLTVRRGLNGTPGSAHNSGTSVSLWRVPDPVARACVIQTVRQMERGLQGFGDARANPELGQLFFTKQADPEAMELLSPYRRHAI